MVEDQIAAAVVVNMINSNVQYLNVNKSNNKSNLFKKTNNEIISCLSSDTLSCADLTR